MLTLRETSYALFGAWRLAHFDRQGTAYFDRSRTGALRSFWAAALLLPAYAVLVLLRLAEHPTSLGWPAIILIYGIAYAIGWTAFPVAMAWIVRLLDREEEYFGYIAMYNWSAVLQALIWLPVAALTAGRMLPQPLLDGLGLAADLAILAYLWFIARAGLRMGAFSAIGVVAVDLVLSEIVLAITDRMIVPLA